MFLVALSLDIRNCLKILIRYYHNLQKTRDLQECIIVYSIPNLYYFYMI